MAFLYKEPLERPGEELRRLMKEEDIIVAPGVYNSAVALLAERMGFKALYLSGAAITGSLAMPDLGVITLHELAMFTRYVTRVVRTPLIVDADTGFGEVINVERTVRELEHAGAAAIQIEDQVLPKKCGHLQGKILVQPEDMVKKILAAVETRKDALIIARTDARGVEGLGAAIERAQIYVEAGADIIFPEALTSIEEFKEFARRVKAPLLANMTEFGKTPYITVEEFREAGYKIVIFPVTTFRASLKASETVLKEIMERGTQKHVLESLYTRQDFYDLIGYHDYGRRDKEVDRRAKEIVSRLKRS